MMSRMGSDEGGRVGWSLSSLSFTGVYCIVSSIT